MDVRARLGLSNKRHGRGRPRQTGLSDKRHGRGRPRQTEVDTLCVVKVSLTLLPVADQWIMT